MAQEYYIRPPDSEDARGPLSYEKLASLAEAGQVDGETLFFDENSEDWMPISSNTELTERLFPKKKKLSLKAKEREDMQMLNVLEDDEKSKPVSVDEFLAAAEGTTEETRHVKKREQSAHLSAKFALPVLGTIMLLNGLSQVYPSWAIIQSIYEARNPLLLVLQPLVMMGLFDLIVSLAVFLAMTELFPLLRARAMLGFGYFGFIFYAGYSNGDTMALYLLLSTAASSLAIFTCTLTRRFSVMLIFGAAGLAGVAGYTALTIRPDLIMGYLEQLPAAAP